MDLLLNAEEQQIKDSFDAVLRKEFDLDRFRDASSPASDVEPVKWRLMAELGWFGLGLPEEVGGVEMGRVGELILFQSLGRHLVTPSVLATVLAAHVAYAANNTNLASAMVQGEASSCLGVVKSGATIDEALEGEVFALDRANSELLLVWNAACAAVLNIGQAASTVRQSFDESLSLDTLQLSECTIEAVVKCVDVDIFQQALLLIAALQIGIAGAARDAAVEYAGIREQFGQPIGAFQAVKHHCADMAIRHEAADSLSRMAALSLDESSGDQGLAASCFYLGNEAALENSRHNIQIHGAMGFTEECHAHRLLKRARVLERIGVRRQDCESLILG